MCKWGTNTTVYVKIPADLSHNGKAHFKNAPIDSCIAPIVKALQAAGIDMRHSCCGHGKGAGDIMLEDRRILQILSPAPPRSRDDAGNYIVAPEDSGFWKCLWLVCKHGMGLAGHGQCSAKGEWDNPDCPSYSEEERAAEQPPDVGIHLGGAAAHAEQSKASGEIDTGQDDEPLVEDADREMGIDPGIEDCGCK